jgi:hypothetical protein
MRPIVIARQFPDSLCAQGRAAQKHNALVKHSTSLKPLAKAYGLPVPALRQSRAGRSTRDNPALAMERLAMPEEKKTHKPRPLY